MHKYVFPIIYRFIKYCFLGAILLLAQHRMNWEASVHAFLARGLRSCEVIYAVALFASLAYKLMHVVTASQGLRPSSSVSRWWSGCKCRSTSFPAHRQHKIALQNGMVKGSRDSKPRKQLFGSGWTSIIKTKQRHGPDYPELAVQTRQT